MRLVAGRLLLFLFLQADDLVDASVLYEGMDVVNLDDHRLQIREDFFVEILFDECLMERFHFMRLIKNDMVFAEFGQNHIVKDVVIFFFLNRHFVIYLHQRI